MTHRITLSAKGRTLYTPLVIQGGYSDLLQLTQPRKPVATDWAEEPRLDTVQTTLEPQPTRPLRIDLWLPVGIPHSTLQRTDTIATELDRTYKVQVQEVFEREQFPNGSIYTLRGTIQQDKAPVAGSTAQCKYIPTSKPYSITTDHISLATLGALPIDGWRKALRDKTAFKVTSPEASRELVLPTLLLGDTVEQLIASRDQLEGLLFSETRNQLTTPYGTFDGYFSRSRLISCSLDRSYYLLYDLTITLV